MALKLAVDPSQDTDDEARRWAAVFTGLSESRSETFLTIPPPAIAGHKVEPSSRPGDPCPKCGGKARRETLECWAPATGWRQVDRLVCMAKPATKRETACRAVTVLAATAIPDRPAPSTSAPTPPRPGAPRPKPAQPAPIPTISHQEDLPMPVQAPQALPADVQTQAPPPTSTDSPGKSPADRRAAAVRLVLDEGLPVSTAAARAGLSDYRSILPALMQERKRRGLPRTRPKTTSKPFAPPAARPAPPTAALPPTAETSLQAAIRLMRAVDVGTYLGLPEASQAAIRHLVTS
ncbi:MAG TPA: hypothetical protein VGO93_29895 [Candidatus Xenobia bacterium]